MQEITIKNYELSTISQQ